MLFQKRREELLEFLKKLPEEQFDYSTYWKVEDCGSVDCVAGWCRALYGSVFDYNTPLNFSKQYLGLTAEEANILFLFNSTVARKEHAISRLQWLVDHGSFEGYPLDGECYERKS